MLVLSLHDVGKTDASMVCLPYSSIAEELHISSGTLNARGAVNTTELIESSSIGINETDLAAFKQRALATK